MRRAAGALAGALALGSGLLLHDRAEAQRIDPRRPAVLVVGAPGGAAPMHRGDGRRSGVSNAPLPSGPLRVAWSTATGLSLGQPALAGPDGLVVVSTRGDVLFLGADGEQQALVKPSGSGEAGPAVITSAGTVVFATARGEVVGVRPAGAQFVSRVSGAPLVSAAPLALDDGGAVLASATELVLVDGDGLLRSRAALPEPPAAPLVAWRDEIVATTATGAVFGWRPGREARRLGSFEGPVDGAAALSGDSLLAVVGGRELAELSLTRGERTTRAMAPSLYLGPPAVRAPTGEPGSATVFGLTPDRGIVVTLGPGGAEQLRAPVASFTPRTLPDGGAPPLVAPPHTGPLVDARGAVAFAIPDGTVGVVGPDGAVELVPEALFAAGPRLDVIGLTPLGPGAFAVTSASGVVAVVTGAASGGPGRDALELGEAAPAPDAGPRAARAPRPR